MNAILQIFQALADATRLRIMLLILEMELSVGELALILEQSQPRVSRHIRILVEAGLINKYKEGSWVFLRPSDTASLKPLASLFATDAVQAEISIRSDREKLQHVRTSRAEMAERYFEEHAAEWDTIRTLHVADAQVEEAILESVSGQALGNLLDIGTGTGRMVEIFGPEATHVTALDKSPAMLRLARAKIGKSGQTPVDFILGDFNALPIDPASTDTVILHQVLHFAQHPEQVIAEAARTLTGNGRMMIVDFASHDHEELRTRDSHARLGFSDSSINRWFSASALTLSHSQSLDGGALTVKIWIGTKNSVAHIANLEENTESKKRASS